MIGHIKKRPILVAIPVAVLVAMPATSLAKTAETPVVGNTDSGPATNEPATMHAPDIATEVEMQRRFNEFRVSIWTTGRIQLIGGWVLLL